MRSRSQDGVRAPLPSSPSITTDSCSESIDITPSPKNTTGPQLQLHVGESNTPEKNLSKLLRSPQFTTQRVGLLENHTTIIRLDNAHILIQYMHNAGIRLLWVVHCVQPLTTLLVNSKVGAHVTKHIRLTRDLILSRMNAAYLSTLSQHQQPSSPWKITLIISKSKGKANARKILCSTHLASLQGWQRQRNPLTSIRPTCGAVTYLHNILFGVNR